MYRLTSPERPGQTAAVDFAFPVVVGPHIYDLWLQPGPFTDAAGDSVASLVDHARRTITVDARLILTAHLLPLIAANAVAAAWQEVTAARL